MAFQIGDRIEDARGQRGTVHYMGPVATSKDQSTVYYGIEWDEWGHGLNDGSVTLPSGNRVIYFDGPTPRVGKGGSSPTLEYKCSFIKQAKLDAEAKHATFIARLQERYDPSAIGGERVSAEAARGRDVVIAGEVGTALGSGRPIELVGVDKLRTQQTLATLEKISLAQCQISSLGISTPGELGAVTPQIVELDLSFNLLRSWSTIFQVLDELPLLESLILTGNRLVYADAEQSGKQYAQVRVLVLNQTMISWANVVKIAERHFPQLEELHFTSNEIGDSELNAVDAKSISTAAFSSELQVLDLSDNDIRSWKTIESQLGGSFPNLKQLVLNGNQIPSLVTPTTTATKPLQKLISLSLNDNLVDSWTSIDALNNYPRLETLRFMRNPLTAQIGVGEARMIMIARVASLQAFNASPVRAKERADAERTYLKRVVHELAVVGSTHEKQASILSSHPRHYQLSERYPEVVAAANASLSGGGSSGPSTLGSSLVQIKIVPMSMNATTFDPLVKKMPQNMKVSTLKVLVEKKFGVPASEQLLSFRADSKSMPNPLDDDNCELGYYGLQDGAEILVNDA